MPRELWWPDKRAVFWRLIEDPSQPNLCLRGSVNYQAKDRQRWTAELDVHEHGGLLRIRSVKVFPVYDIANHQGKFPSVNANALRGVQLVPLLESAEAWLREHPGVLRNAAARYRHQGGDEVAELIEARLPVMLELSDRLIPGGSQRGHRFTDDDDRATAELFIRITRRIDEEGRQPQRGELQDEMAKELSLTKAAVRYRLRRATEARWLTRPPKGSWRRAPGPRWAELGNGGQS